MPVQYSYTSTPPIGSTACTGHQCLYSVAIPLLPYWLYSLYRASVPVQYSYTSTPLFAVQPVQSLSACTVQLYIYSPYWLYRLYRTSVPVQYFDTSTPPMGRTACTEPQCLYSTAIPLLPLLAALIVQSLSACTVQLYLYSPYGPYSLYRGSVPVQ